MSSPYRQEIPWKTDPLYYKPHHREAVETEKSTFNLHPSHRAELLKELITKTASAIESAAGGELSNRIFYAHMGYPSDSQLPRDAPVTADSIEYPEDGPRVIEAFMRQESGITVSCTINDSADSGRLVRHCTVDQLPTSIVMEAATAISDGRRNRDHTYGGESTRLGYESDRLDYIVRARKAPLRFFTLKLAELDARQEYLTNPTATECRNRFFFLSEMYSAARQRHLSVGRRSNIMEIVSYHHNMWEEDRGNMGSSFDYLVRSESRHDQIPRLSDIVKTGDNEEARAARLSDDLGLLINYVEESKRAHETYSRMEKTRETFAEASISERTRRLKDLARVVEKNRTPTETLGDPFE